MLSDTMLLFIMAIFANTITDNVFVQTSTRLIKNDNVIISYANLGKPICL